MVKLLVPEPLVAEFSADSRFKGEDWEAVGDFREALRLLTQEENLALFMGPAAAPLDMATLNAAVAPFYSLAQPVMLISSDARLLWANETAALEGISLEMAPHGEFLQFFEPTSRRCFQKGLDRCLADKVLARAIILRGEAAFEATLVPAGDKAHALAAVVLSRKDDPSLLYDRVSRLSSVAVNLFPEDVEALVRLPNEKRINLIKELIEKTVKQTFEYDDFILRTLDAKTGSLDPILARSGTGATLSKRMLHAGKQGGSVAGFVAATGEPYLVEDAASEPLWIGDLEQIQSAVVVPLKLGSRVLGTFAIEKREKFAFDRYDLVLAVILGGYITAALDMADLVGLGQSVLVEQVAESAAEEVAGHLKNISDSVADLRRHNIGDSIAVTSRLESISASASTIRDAILKGARKVGAAVAAPPATEDVLAGKRILVADDEATILQSLGDILRSHGCEVDFARDGFEAVEMATNAIYDLVISDIKMPKMSGYEVYSSIKSKFPETSVILMTAYGYDPTHSIVRARQEGLEAVLYKPFRAETLKKALRQAFGKKEAGA